MKNFLLTTLFCFSVNAAWAADSDETKAQPAAKTNNNSEKKAADESKISRAVPRLKHDQELDLASLLSDSFTQVIKLTALDTEFDLYYLSAEEKEPIASVLFFPDERSHSDWPISLNPLRVGLTKYKWQTAVLTLPEPVLASIPERTEYPAITTDNDDKAKSSENPPAADDTATQSDTINKDSDTAVDTKQTGTDSEATATPEEPPQTLAEISIARAIVATQMLKQKSDSLIIAGIGQGATWATAYALTLAVAEKDQYRLLLINPQQSLDKSAPLLTEMISQLSIDTFDLYTQSKASSMGSSNAEQGRKRAANRSEVEQYAQIKAPSSAWKQRGNTWLFKKVRGILKNQVEPQFSQKALEKNRPVAPKKTNQKPGSTSD